MLLNTGTSGKGEKKKYGDIGDPLNHKWVVLSTSSEAGIKVKATFIVCHLI